MVKAKIYTDGACSGNPGPGGWAALIIFPTNKQEISGCELDTTNNRMELTAVVESVALAQSLGCEKIEVYSDSAYVVNAVKKEWLKKWNRTGWKTIKGENVKNKDLWVKLTTLVKAGNVSMIKVKGHAGNKNNERVDGLAKREIEGMRMNGLAT